NNLYISNGENLYNGSKMATSGITFTRFLSGNTYIKIILSGFYEWGGTHIDTLNTNQVSKPPYIATRYYSEGITESRISLTAITGTKFNARLSSKAGCTIDQMGFNLSALLFNETLKRLGTILNDTKNIGDREHLVRAYYEISDKITDQFTVNPGLQLMYF